HDLAAWLEQGGDVPGMDVRGPAEGDEGHIPSAISLPMFGAGPRRDEVPRGKTCAVVCAGGLRSSAVIGALKRHGLGSFVNVTGGMAAWVKAGYSVTRENPPAVDTVIPASVAAAGGAVVDCRGLSCPWPSMKLANPIEDVTPG